MSAASQSSSWPGEREDPTHHDVASANELPDPALLSDFKRALMSSGDAAGAENLLHMDLKDTEPASTKYTYPLALLSNCPRSPSDDRLAELSHIFSQRCMDHVFFDRFPVPAPYRERIAPPLRFGIACLASVCSHSDAEEARSLFLAGTKLWLVMLEVDNGLARSIELLLAAVLLVPYGVLGDNVNVCKLSTLIMSSSMTIARRMRLHEPWQLGPGLGQRISSYSSLIWALWLWDVIHAVHSNLPLNFSSNEVLSRMSSPSLSFQDVYRSLFQEYGGCSPSPLATIDGASQDQAILLLLAILSDSITIRRSLGGTAHAINPTQAASFKHNPFVPLSAHTELERMQSQLSVALDRWNAKFDDSMSRDVMALYHYARLFLSCPAISDLQLLAKYYQPESGQQTAGATGIATDICISDKSVSHAWTLLDVAAKSPKSEDLRPAWMPVVVFHAALVVWASITFEAGGGRVKHGSARARPSLKHGSTRALLAFKAELEAMSWPCCADMTATLQRLMSE